MVRTTTHTTIEIDMDHNNKHKLKMAHPSIYLEDLDMQQVAVPQYGNSLDVPIETPTTLNLLNTSMETRYCNLSEILQQPGTSITNLNSVQVLIPINECTGIPAFTRSKLTESLGDPQIIGNAKPFDVLKTHTDQTQEIELIEIVLNNSLEKRVENAQLQKRAGQKQKSCNNLLPTFVPIPDRKAPPRAQAVLPLCLKYSRGEVQPRTHVPELALFGPVEGIIEKLSRAEARHLICECAAKRRPVFLIPNEDGSFIHIDVSDQDKSNWIGLLSLGDGETANVWLHLSGDKLFAVTTKSLPPRRTLAIGYSKEYADILGIPSSQPVLDLDEELSRGRTEGKKGSRRGGAANEQDTEKADEKMVNRYKYRCKHCLRRFSRLFCLRRHHSRCTKKKLKEVDASDAIRNSNLQTTTTVTQTEKQKQTDQTEEETRLPSDESLQNYTNLLDFSINLFDADRMLDCSDKSDDLNPINLRDDRMVNDFQFPDGLFTSSPKKQNKKNDVQEKSSHPFTCPYCKDSIMRSKYRQHARWCPARGCECRCGRRFRTKEACAQHVLRDHPCDTPAPGTQGSKNESNPGKNKAVKEKDENVLQPNANTKSSDVSTKSENLQKTSVQPLKILTDSDRIDVLKNTDGSITKINDVQNETDVLSQKTEDSGLIDNKYQCPQCNLVFKRRGMLVNHLSRSHGAPAAARALPLVVPERRFPCPEPACGKLYRAAQKRKQHMIRRHPGLKVSPSQLQCIEVSRRRQPPARCWACPRQYATRAKLLQHARQQHPTDVPPPQPQEEKIKLTERD